MTNEQDAGPNLNHLASIAGLIGVAAAIVAAAAIWLMLTEPLTLANAIGRGEISPLVRQFAQVIYEMMAGLLDYL